MLTLFPRKHPQGPLYASLLMNARHFVLKSVQASPIVLIDSVSYKPINDFGRANERRSAFGSGAPSYTRPTANAVRRSAWLIQRCPCQPALPQGRTGLGRMPTRAKNLAERRTSPLSRTRRETIALAGSARAASAGSVDWESETGCSAQQAKGNSGDDRLSHQATWQYHRRKEA